ncbi:hypothetical protein KP509_1Z243700 [Ceratopteris richardii]|nr:hypothetical protein KP509_1Z243700 [Ceratopteris richardii]
MNSCKDEVANVNGQGDQVALVDCEESSCSHNTHLSGQVGMVVATQHGETIEQSSAENTPSQVSLHGDPCVHNEAPCLEGRIVVAMFCQASEKESSFVNLSHNVSDDASNKFSTPPSAANDKKFNNSASEIDKVHTRSGESPAITYSCRDFDLNKGFAMDEFLQSSCDPPSTNTCSMAMKATGTLSAPIAVSATSKGAFVPPVNALCKSDIGWTGSAATSAFRPAEPRHAPARSQQIQQHEKKNINSFDLNVPDQDSIEEYPPLSGHGMQGAHLDLNQEIQSRCSTICVSRNLKHLQTDGFKQHPEKRAVLDFDLNEQLEEVKQEEEAMLCTESRTYGGPISFGGLSGQVTVGNDACWHATEGTFYPGPSFNGSRIELFSSSSANQLSVVSTRQVTPTTIFPSGLPIYSHTAPFLGGPISTPFPASFSYNPIPIGADTASMVAKSMSGTSVSSLGTHLRTDTSVRPAFVTTSVDDFRGGNNLYTWGRAPQNVYRNHGPTIISYSDAAASGREHAMNFDASTSLEEHMRLFPQAAVPVSSLKRRDPDFFSGLKQTWH